MVEKNAGEPAWANTIEDRAEAASVNVALPMYFQSGLNGLV